MWRKLTGSFQSMEMLRFYGLPAHGKLHDCNLFNNYLTNNNYKTKKKKISHADTEVKK